MNPRRFLALAESCAFALPTTTFGQDLTPAQIHLGHVVDSVNGTPESVGLVTALEQEARIAAQHAKLAAANTANLTGSHFFPLGPTV